jgi:hypothetical protein
MYFSRDAEILDCRVLGAIRAMQPQTRYLGKQAPCDIVAAKAKRQNRTNQELDQSVRRVMDE